MYENDIFRWELDVSQRARASIGPRCTGRKTFGHGEKK